MQIVCAGCMCILHMLPLQRHLSMMALLCRLVEALPLDPAKTAYSLDLKKVLTNVFSTLSVARNMSSVATLHVKQLRP